MANSTVPFPDKVVATGDPGDETARRYRYQWTYAAILCCMLLDDTEDVSEVFCEHHEDVLLKHTDGTFSGLQIKTRASDQGVWKTTDDTLKDSCARFAKLEHRFPGQFRAFRFLTNHPLHKAENAQDIRYALGKIKAVASVSALSGPVAAFLNRIIGKAGCSADVVFTALSKTDASDDLPKLSDIELRLVSTLTGVWNRASDCSYGSVVRAALSLSSECGRASSLAHQDVLPGYLPATGNIVEAELAARLAGKRINKSRLLDLLDLGLNEVAPLDGKLETITEPGAGSKDLLSKKLNVGGFSAVSLNSAVDLRDKADYLGIKWTKMYGRKLGLQRYGHIRSIVLSDAARAFEDTKNDHRLFGLEMLSELRSRFQQRRSDNSLLYDCSNEHLEGFAYSLTSECKVQWSRDRAWEEE